MNAETHGQIIGDLEGSIDGLLVFLFVGALVGAFVGILVFLFVGALVGILVFLFVGEFVTNAGSIARTPPSKLGAVGISVVGEELDGFAEELGTADGATVG